MILEHDWLGRFISNSETCLVTNPSWMWKGEWFGGKCFSSVPNILCLLKSSFRRLLAHAAPGPTATTAMTNLSPETLCNSTTCHWSKSFNPCAKVSVPFLLDYSLIYKTNVTKPGHFWAANLGLVMEAVAVETWCSCLSSNTLQQRRSET